MKKLNNNGMSIIELLVCFVIVAVIAITLLNTVMEYKSDEMTESVRNHILEYKNSVTRVIQTDILNNKLISYTTSTENCEVKKDSIVDVINCDTAMSSNPTNLGEKRTITLKFAKSFTDASTTPIYEKKLIIVRSNKFNYISYEDVVEDADEMYLQEARYILEPFSNIYDINTKNFDSNTPSKIEYNDVRFLTLGTIDNTNDVFSLNIPIYYSEFGNRYQISIVAPFTKIY